MNGYGISKAELKKHNRICILQTILESGPISRIDIARKLHITRGAITVLSNEMIQQNIIREVGDGQGDNVVKGQKGRRKVLLDIDYDRYFLLGACVDENNISIGLTTLDGRSLEKSNILIDRKCTAENAAEIIRISVDGILRHSGMDMSSVIGMGVAVMPAAFSIEGITGISGEPDYRHIESLVSKRLNIPVYAGNGINLLALASFGGAGRERTVANRALIYADRNRIRVSVVCGNHIRSDADEGGEDISYMCVRPDGVREDGYCKGSARAELTATAIGRKVSGIINSIDTPELCRLTGGSSKAVTLGQLLSAYSGGDEVLRQLRMETLDSFCLMLNNISVAFGTDRLSLCGFGLSQSQLSEIHRHAEAFGGREFADKIRLCHIDRLHGFVSGCAYAAINGFFRTGGAIGCDEM